MTADTAASIQAVLDAARTDGRTAARYFNRGAYWDQAVPAADRFLAAIDALPSPDECEELLRLADVGRAVESLRAVLPLGWGASLNMTQGDDDGHPYSVQVWNERVENVLDTMPDWCATVPEAVDAAIGVGDDLADPREWR